MNWGSLQTFFAMGGAGDFVWGSYGVMALLVVAELYLLVRHRRETVRILWRRQRAGGIGQGGESMRVQASEVSEI